MELFLNTSALVGSYELTHDTSTTGPDPMYIKNDSLFLLRQGAPDLSPVQRLLFSLAWYVKDDFAVGICNSDCLTFEDLQGVDPLDESLVAPMVSLREWRVVREAIKEVLSGFIAPDSLTCIAVEEVLGQSFDLYLDKTYHKWSALNDAGKLRRWFCYNLAVRLANERTSR
jgi:hypothetical protein